MCLHGIGDLARSQAAWGRRAVWRCFPFDPLQSAFRSVPHTLASALANGVGALLLQIVVEELRPALPASGIALKRRRRMRPPRRRSLWRCGRGFTRIFVSCPHLHCGFVRACACAGGIRCSAPEPANAPRAESNATEWVTLAEELEFVRGYLEIEQYRMGDRLTVLWSLDPAATRRVSRPSRCKRLSRTPSRMAYRPRCDRGRLDFHTQACAVYSGRRRRYRGRDARRTARKSAGQAEEGRAHGLQLAGRQLALLYGPAVRIRLLTQLEKGTIAAFILPDERNAARKPGLKKGTEETGENKIADGFDRG